MLKKYEAIIFDLDGTLVDSMWMWLEIDVDFLKSKGKEVPKNLQKNIEGMSFTETAKYFIEEFSLSESVEELKTIWRDMASKYFMEKVHLKEGVYEFLTYLKEQNIPLGIATSNTKELTKLAVEKNEIKHFFKSIRTSCEVDKGKPYPYIYLKVANDLNVKPNKCLAFEDTEAGMNAALSAGMDVISIYDKTSEDYKDILKEKSIMYINSFKELMDKIRRD